MIMGLVEIVNNVKRVFADSWSWKGLWSWGRCLSWGRFAREFRIRKDCRNWNDFPSEAKHLGGITNSGMTLIWISKNWKGF